MEAFGIFGFMIGMVALFFAMLAYSQIAGLKAEMAALKAEARRALRDRGARDDAG